MLLLQREPLYTINYILVCGCWWVGGGRGEGTPRHVCSQRSPSHDPARDAICQHAHLLHSKLASRILVQVGQLFQVLLASSLGTQFLTLSAANKKISIQKP
jgi:hypothetical protein